MHYGIAFTPLVPTIVMWIALAVTLVSALVLLAARGLAHAATVAALLRHGADPDRANDRGQTPLAGAVFKGEDEVVRVLVDGGADPAAGTPSAIDTARMFGKDALLELFGAV